MYATELGLPHDRDTLTSLSNQLKMDHGLDYLAKQAHRLMQTAEKSKVVFDSIRHPDEVQYLSSLNVYFIGVSASLTTLRRIQSRKRDTDFVTFDEFREQDEREFYGVSKGQSVADCLKLCDDVITNDSDIANLHKAVDNILSKFS